MKKVLVSNEKKVNEWLNKEQSDRMTRTVDYEDIMNAVKEFISELGIPKKYISCTFLFNRCAQRFPSSYKYTPMGTLVFFEVVNGKFYITNIFRGNCNGNGNRFKLYSMSDEMRGSIVARFEQF